jgi:hypothetical protein
MLMKASHLPKIVGKQSATSTGILYQQRASSLEGDGRWWVVGGWQGANCWQRCIPAANDDGAGGEGAGGGGAEVGDGNGNGIELSP